MQLSDWPQVEVQVLGVELEALGKVVNGLLQLHERQPHVLDLFGRQRLFFEAPDGLPLHQFSDEFDEAEDEFDDRALNVFGLRIPAQDRGLWGSWGASGPWGTALAQTLTGLPRRSSPTFFRAEAGHAVERFALPSLLGGIPITFLISLIKSCGRHGLVITTSQPALFALSE